MSFVLDRLAEYGQMEEAHKAKELREQQLKQLEAEHLETIRLEREKNSIIEPDFEFKKVETLVKEDVVERVELTPSNDELINSRPNKMVKRMERARTESLVVIDDLIKHYEIKSLEDMQPPVAWGKLFSGQYKHESIKEIAGKKITYHDGKTQTKGEFSEQYRTRFK